MDKLRQAVTRMPSVNSLWTAHIIKNACCVLCTMLGTETGEVDFPYFWN